MPIKDKTCEMKKNILLIDDDELFLTLTRETLKGASFLQQIKCINHVKDAREYLDSCMKDEQNFPDMIFLDLDMPGIGGLDFAELYRRKYAEIFPQTKLVVLSSSIYWKDRKHAMGIPCVAAFLQKPLTEDKVQQLLLSEEGLN